MTEIRDNSAGPKIDVLLKPAIDVVCRATLELLGSLPERPQRMRVRAADVTVDLDWRTWLAAPVDGSVGPRSAESAEQATVGAHACPTRDDSPDQGDAVLDYVCAPTIGTFYHAREPGAPPFVVAGTVVRAGQQVGIVEAMKMMVPVEAERPGRVVEVVAADGQPVEYDERLVALAPIDTDRR